MKIALLALVMGFVSTSHAQKHMQVLLRHGVPAIGYNLKPSQTSQALYTKFGMSDSLFLRLNQHDSTQKYDDNIIYLAVNEKLQTACAATACTELYYLATAQDNFKTIADNFGIPSPFTLKELNPLLESVALGDPVLVGYLPTALFYGNAAPATTTKASPPFKKVYSGIGYYAPEYMQTDTTILRGKASNVKSLAAWYDGKYYCLSNEVETGSILKITNPKNGLFLYAKVVGPLPEIKSSKTILARICNAACAMLDIWDDQEFDVVIEQ